MRGVRVLSRCVKLAISCASFVLQRFYRVILGRVGKQPQSKCIILYYHSVPLEQRALFARQMDILTRRATPIDLRREYAFNPGANYAAVTFDDVFEDVVENAVPELISRHIPATFFVTVDAIGKPAEWWPTAFAERGRKIVSLEQLRTLPEQWIAVEAHTMSHPKLSQLGEEKAKYEICEPRTALKKLLGSDIQSVSVPYGDFSDAVVEWCRAAGYKRVYTTEHKDASNMSVSFVVGRVKADPTDWDLEFMLKLQGCYTWLPVAIHWKRVLLSRLRPGRSDQNWTKHPGRSSAIS